MQAPSRGASPIVDTTNGDVTETSDAPVVTFMG